MLCSSLCNILALGLGSVESKESEGSWGLGGLSPWDSSGNHPE